MPIVALSLKMYFTRTETLDYCRDLVRLLKHLGEERERVTMALLPDHLVMAEAAAILLPAGIRLGTQDLCPADRGAYTGEVSGTDLANLGVSVAEVGHVERRRVFHEDDDMVLQKTEAAWRNRMTPLLCIGEVERMQDTARAAEFCLGQVERVVQGHVDRPLWLGYEPVWAIGADRPASVEYIRQVCRNLRWSLAGEGYHAKILYGGSAGPGLLSRLWPCVDGVFLGRFAHKPEHFLSVVKEALALRQGWPAEDLDPVVGS